MGFDPSASKHCISELRLTVSEAVEIMSDELFVVPSSAPKKKASGGAGAGGKKKKPGLLSRVLGLGGKDKDKEEVKKEEERAEDSFFYGLALCLYWRLKTFNAHCAVCHEPMHSGSFKPLPCGQELCQFRFEEVLGDSLAREITHHYHRFTIELSLAWSAIFSHRNQ